MYSLFCVTAFFIAFTKGHCLSIYGGGLPKVGDRLRRSAGFAFENTEHAVNAIVLGQEIECAIKPPSRSIEVALTQREHTPIRPSGRLAGGELGHDGEHLVSGYVIADLKSRQRDVEVRNRIEILPGRYGRQFGARMTSREHDDQTCRQDNR
jgi:hypothetical protein